MVSYTMYWKILPSPSPQLNEVVIVEQLVKPVLYYTLSVASFPNSIIKIFIRYLTTRIIYLAVNFPRARGPGYRSRYISFLAPYSACNYM